MNTYLINFLDLDLVHNEILVQDFNERNAIIKHFKYRDLYEGKQCIESIVLVSEEITHCIGCKEILCQEEIEYYGDLCFSCGDEQELQRWS